MSLISYDALLGQHGTLPAYTLGTGNVVLGLDQMNACLLYHPAAANSTVTLPTGTSIASELQLAVGEAVGFTLVNTSTNGSNSTLTVATNDTTISFRAGSSGQAAVGPGCATSFTITCLDYNPLTLQIDPLLVGGSSSGIPGDFSQPLPIFNVQAYGAKADGVTNDLVAIHNAIAAWGAKGAGTLVFPTGAYSVSNSIDFSNHLPATAIFAYMSVVAPPSAQMVPSSSYSAAQLINLAAPEGGQFLYCHFQFGVINGATKNTNGIRIRNVNDSIIFIQLVTNCATSSGVAIDESGTPQAGCFNNSIHVVQLSANSIGFSTLGNNGVFGFQGNQVVVNQTIANGIGFSIDAAGVANSVANVFNLGPVEGNTGGGIIDNNGGNAWYLADTNTNGVAGFILGPSTSGCPYVVGRISDGVNLNGRSVRMYNRVTPSGYVTDKPAVPASGSSAQNNLMCPVQVIVSGGTVTAINILTPAGGAITGLSSGTFILQAGDSIELTYSVAPTVWQWIAL